MWVAAASIDVRVVSSACASRSGFIVVRNALTTVGSNWLPAWARSSRRAASGERRGGGGGAGGGGLLGAPTARLGGAGGGVSPARAAGGGGSLPPVCVPGRP